MAMRRMGCCSLPCDCVNLAGTPSEAQAAANRKIRNGGAMTATIRSLVFSAAATLVICGLGDAQAQQGGMSFFVTTAGPGKGADLGGLDGADRQCQQLAQSAGAGGHTWHAYLSTQAADGKPAVNARDRIGKGPWQNAKGVVVAKDVGE